MCEIKSRKSPGEMSAFFVTNNCLLCGLRFELLDRSRYAGSRKRLTFITMPLAWNFSVRVVGSTALLRLRTRGLRGNIPSLAFVCLVSFGEARSLREIS